jgi:hypothetical protein
MEKHATSRRLDSYTVTGRTIQHITNFIQNRLPHFLPAENEEVGDLLYNSTSLTIHGSRNSVTYRPVHKFTQTVFNNDINALSLELAFKGEEHTESPDAGQTAVVLLIRFGRAREDSELSVAIQGKGAKETTLRIEDGILRTLEPDRNRNRIAYPNDFIPTLVFVVGFIIGLGGLIIENRLLKSICAILFGAAFYYVAHRFTQGYCNFESNHQRRLDLLLKWLTRAIVLFMLIAIIHSALL